MVVSVEHAAESVASSYAKAGDLARSRERHGQWLGAGAVSTHPYSGSSQHG
jgi:hypothetical protein